MRRKIEHQFLPSHSCPQRDSITTVLQCKNLASHVRASLALQDYHLMMSQLQYHAGCLSSLNWNVELNVEMENGKERTQLRLTCVTGASCLFQVELPGVCLAHHGGFMNKSSLADMLLYPGVVPLAAPHHMLGYCSLAKPNSHTKGKSLALRD